MVKTNSAIAFQKEMDLAAGKAVLTSRCGRILDELFEAG